MKYIVSRERMYRFDAAMAPEELMLSPMRRVSPRFGHREPANGGSWPAEIVIK